MEIYRTAPRREFVSIPNRAIEEREMSWKARGILVWLLSRPPGWSTDSVRLARESTDGRDATRTGLAELERYGYLTRVQAREKSGVWATRWAIHDEPVPVEERTWTPPKQRVRKPKETVAGAENPHRDGLPGAGDPARVDRTGSPGATSKTNTKTDNETHLSSSSSTQGRAQAPRPRSAQQPKMLLPDAWKPSQETIDWAITTRPDVDLQWTYDKFVAHRQENQQRSANWDADFKAWVERERSDDADVIDLRDRPSTSTPKSGPDRPEWCGDCDEQGRMWEMSDGRWARCPVCHPLMAGVL